MNRPSRFGLLLGGIVLVAGAAAVGWFLRDRFQSGSPPAGEPAPGRKLAEAAQAKARIADYARRVTAASGYLEAGNATKARLALASCPDEMRGWEWQHLSRRCQGEIRRFPVPEGGGTLAHLTEGAEARLVCAVGQKDALQVFDLVKGQPVRSLATPDARAGMTAFSADGKALASVSERIDGKGEVVESEVKVWDVSKGEARHSLHKGPGSVLGLAMSSDGRRVAACLSDGKEGCLIKAWDAVVGKETLSHREAESQADGLCFSPDGKRLAGCVPGKDSLTGTVVVWEAEGGKEAHRLGCPFDECSNPLYSPDGRRVAAVIGRDRVRLWDSATGHALLDLEAGRQVSRLAIDPAGKQVAVGCSDGSIRLYDAATGRRLQTLLGHETKALETSGSTFRFAQVVGLAFHPSGQSLASAGADGTARLWDAPEPKGPFAMQGLKGDFAFGPDGRRVLATLGYSTGRMDRSGRWVSKFGEAVVQDIWTGQVFLRLAHEGAVKAVAWSGDGRRLATGGDDKRLKIWDAVSGKLLARHDLENEPSALAFNHDGSLLASAESSQITLWKATGGKVKVLAGHDAPVTCLAFSPDGRILASADGFDTYQDAKPHGQVKLWDAASGKELHALRHDHQVTHASFHPDGKRLASSSKDGTVRVWDVGSGKEELRLDGHRQAVSAVAFSPDGKRLASAGADEHVRIWDTEGWQELLALPGFEDEAGIAKGRMAFTPDGKALVHVGPFGFSKTWTSSSPPADISEIRHAQQVARTLFRAAGLREEAARRINEAKLPESVRKRALALVEAEPQDPFHLNSLSWKVVKAPGAGKEAYQLARRQAELATQLDPHNSAALNTLGAAQYRAGEFKQALETLKASSALAAKTRKSPLPADLAFLAMTHHQLSQPAEAKEALGRLREAAKTEKGKTQAEAQLLLREVEETIEGKKAP